MAKDFYNDELNDFLRQQVEEYTMRPSEKVWKGVRKNMFWQRNWYSVAGSVLALSLLFLLPEFLSTLIHNAPKPIGKSVKNNSTAAPILSSNPSSGKLKTIPSPVHVGTHPALVVDEHVLPIHTGAAIVSMDASASQELRIVKLSSYPAPKRQIHAGPTSPASSITIIAEPQVNTEEKAAEAASAATEEISEPLQKYHGDLNWLQELALIKLTPPKRNRFNLQFHFSPMVSYRTLTDNSNNTHKRTGSGPLEASQFDINQYVDHQPSVGAELGSSILFKASNNLTIRTGLQLNYSRYTIKAYKTGYEEASIALKTPGRADDTVRYFSTIRNINGYLVEQLQNQYFQLSVPIGAELKLLGNKRFQFNIAGTIQPTYLLLNDTYLLSTNYINYIKEPSLVRRWNVHSSAEAYISYQFANVRWQVGPQFRYQLLSSFADRYPVKEYLMEYGIKVGISKTLK